MLIFLEGAEFMNLFEAVKQSVTARQAAEAYGIRAGRNGMAVCPFHPDKNPSMKLDRRYHCFACQADGDVIDFVSAYFSLSLKEAAVKLAEDFQIPYDNWKPPDRRYRKAVPKKSLEQKFTERQNLYFRILCRYRNQLYRWKTEHAPKSLEEEWHPLFCEALERITRVNYLLDILLFGSLEDRVHFKNGTYFLDGTFSPEKEWTMNRLPVSYNPDVPKPERWLSFLDDLLEPEDIPALQEFMGYVLIPSNRGQKMLLMIGKGGEGKSRIGRVLRALLGDNMNTGSIQKLENDRFHRSDQEGKLLFLDDDMRMEALPSTNNIKSIVTMEDKIDLEQKGKQSRQGYLYVRIICLGNGSLKSLHDQSYGFYRRQVIITTKDRPPDRVDDCYLGDKLRAEADGIALWCLEGLKRLRENGFRFIRHFCKKHLRIRQGFRSLAVQDIPQF